jgi:chemotaxis signal transduction protein
VAGLRRAFDEAFAAPPPGRAAGQHDLIAIRVSGHPYALRIAELRGLERDLRLTPLPSSHPELLGLASIRGRLVSVFSLAVLLGYPGGRADGDRWLALSDAGEPLGLAFEGFDGHRRVEEAQICPAADGARREHLAEVVRLPEGTSALISVASIAAALRARQGRVRERERAP